MRMFGFGKKEDKKHEVPQQQKSFEVDGRWDRYYLKGFILPDLGEVVYITKNCIHKYFQREQRTSAWDVCPRRYGWEEV
ncbi:MAG: hypothetical protein N2Z80_06915 [Hydrogenothermaceae bacterium]|nr:hypothetical protein [Hydrogenothermaceae bacterium]